MLSTVQFSTRLSPLCLKFLISFTASFTWLLKNLNLGITKELGSPKFKKLKTFLI